MEVNRSISYGSNEQAEILNAKLDKKIWIPPMEYFDENVKQYGGTEYDIGKIYSYPIEICNYGAITLKGRYPKLTITGQHNYSFNFPNVYVKQGKVYFFEFSMADSNGNKILSNQNAKVFFNDYSIEEYLTKIKNKDDEVLGILNKPPYNQLKTNVQNK
jgi:hypothetical protein